VYDFLAHCRLNKSHVPGEVAVIGYDGCPTPSTVRAPWAYVAQTAGEDLNTLL